MRSTLLMQLVGPMQSWGLQSRFTLRDTGLEPTKSGVIGLVCAALGRDRGKDISDLATLRMGVRVIREGQVREDFQTAGRDGYLRASGSVETSDVIVSRRYYLADAAFIVGLEGEDRTLLEEIDTALHDPVWPICLGRRSFVPVRPVWMSNGVVDTALFQALVSYVPGEGTLDVPFSLPHYHSTETVRYIIEYDPDDSSLDWGIRRLAGADQPISFRDRRFALREVVVLNHPKTMEVEYEPE